MGRRLPVLQPYDRPAGTDVRRGSGGVHHRRRECGRDRGLLRLSAWPTTAVVRWLRREFGARAPEEHLSPQSAEWESTAAFEVVSKMYCMSCQEGIAVGAEVSMEDCPGCI